MKNVLLLITFIAMGIAPAMAQMPDMGDLGNLGGLVGKFAKKGLDPSALAEDFDAKSFAKDAKGMSDIGDLGGHINNLIGAVKPEMWKDGVDINALKEAGKSAKTIADATGLMDKVQNSLIKKAFKGNWKPEKFSKALGLLG